MARNVIVAENVARVSGVSDESKVSEGFATEGRPEWYFERMANMRIEQLKEILEQDPNNALTRYALGMEYSVAGETEAAVQTFGELIKVNADYANAYFMGAQALQGAGRTDEAKQWLTNGIAAARRKNNKHAEGEMQAMLDELSH